MKSRLFSLVSSGSNLLWRGEHLADRNTFSDKVFLDYITWYSICLYSYLLFLCKYVRWLLSTFNPSAFELVEGRCVLRRTDLTIYHKKGGITP
jgi:hypothetical protein